MSKELGALECLERIDNTLCLNNIKGKLEFGIDDEEHIDCDNAISMTDDLETIKQALLELKAIKETNLSEALNELYRIENNIIYSLRDCDISEEVSMNFNSIMEHNSCAIIKNYILKAQEPKNYLKWEDLEFKETHKIRILMNDNLYNLFCYDEKYIEIRTIKGEFILTLDNDNPEDKQFFNDLHLERVEE